MAVPRLMLGRVRDSVRLYPYGSRIAPAIRLCTARAPDALAIRAGSREIGGMHILGMQTFAWRGSRWRRAAAGAAGLACASAGLPLLAAATAAEVGPTCSGLEAGPTRTVTRILDGETVALDDGRELRLIGALAPRAIDADAEAGAWPAEAAATEALRALVLGRSVELRFGGERRDRYGRLLAQAFLIEGEGRRWVQGVLLQQGLARAYALAGSRGRRCSAELLAAERPARQARLGLWAEAAYQVRSADKPAELVRYRATFQVVQGVIVRVGQTRGRIYLNFDRNWRRGFSGSLRRGDASLLLGTYAGNPRALEGRRVRVRGWIGERGGAPVIDLSVAGAVEILGEIEGEGQGGPGPQR
jgi:endonuclease YncB( thermonuclease family)